jgi:V/A-type H+-transporting ATPase subunit D
MAKVKLTKTELKTQSDALKRFQRFLPMLQLKKQQLQAELAVIAARRQEVAARESAAYASLSGWVTLFSETDVKLDGLVTVDRVVTETSNVAGVPISVFTRIDTTAADMDLFTTPAWTDNAVTMLTAILSLKAEHRVLEMQHELITAELRTTAQRVNLFEKVKIPECRENIRVIKIAIGDAQTAAVTRGKIAKSRSRQAEEEDAA